MKSGTMDLRGNGYQMASQIVADRLHDEGQPVDGDDLLRPEQELHRDAPGHDDQLQRHARQQRPLGLALAQLVSKKSWSSISPWSSTDATAGAVGAVMP